MTVEKNSEPREWVVVGSSVRGVSHEKSGLPCQDEKFWDRVGQGYLVLACADGAGSAKHSQIGAKTAVHAAVGAACASLRNAVPVDEDGWRTLLRSAASTAHREVLKKAAEIGQPTRELASTLLLAVAGPSVTAVLQIGDGAIVQWSEDGIAVALTVPDYGEHINETFFVTTESNVATAQCKVYYGTWRPLAMFSDGIEMLALEMPKKVPHRRFFEPLFTILEKAGGEQAAQSEIESLLTSRGVREKTDDDLTLVVAWPPLTTETPSWETSASKCPEAPVAPRHKAPSPKSVPAPASAPPPKSVPRALGAPLPSRPHQRARDSGAASATRALPGPSAAPDARSPARELVVASLDRGAGVRAPRAWARSTAPLVVLALFAGFGGGRLSVPETQPRTGGAATTYTSASAAPVSTAAPHPLERKLPPSPFLGPCVSTETCAPFLQCVARQCRRLFKSGEPCRVSDECARPFACREGLCTKPETRSGKKGALPSRHTCKDDTDCAGELLCVAQHCRHARLSAGQECKGNDDCEDTLICVEARCMPERVPLESLP